MEGATEADITALILKDKFIAVTYMKKRAKVSRINLPLCFKELRKQKQNLKISSKKAREMIRRVIKYREPSHTKINEMRVVLSISFFK